ncbi:hypothetical protein ACN9MO_33105 (plasmid) [Ensifer sp. R-19]
MENASRASLDAVRKSTRQIRKTPGATRVDPKLLTAAERLQDEGHIRREQTDAAIMALAKDGMTIKEIVRRTDHSRGLVRQVLRGQRNDVFRSRESSLEMNLEWLDNGLPASGKALTMAAYENTALSPFAPGRDAGRRGGCGIVDQHSLSQDDCSPLTTS